MAKQGSKGEYICGHCGASDMRIKDQVNKGNGVIRFVFICNKCGGEDCYDSHGN